MELYAILDHAEARYGDDRLEKVSPTPLQPIPIPPSESSSPQILSIVAEELPVEDIPAEEDAVVE